MDLNYWGVFLFCSDPRHLSLVHWEEALLSLDGSSTDMHGTAVDFSALFTLLKWKKIHSWIMTYFYLFTHFFTTMWNPIFCLIQPPATLFRKDLHLIPSDMVSATLQFLRGMAQEVEVASLCCWIKGFQTTQRQKNEEPLPHFFSLAQFLITQPQAFAWDVWDRNLVRLFSLYGQRTGRNASRGWFASLFDCTMVPVAYPGCLGSLNT